MKELDLINGMLWDARLPELMRTPEFSTAIFRLQAARDDILLGHALRKDQVDYIAQAYKHLQNIAPHIEYLTVNGEENQPVQFVTKGLNSHENGG